jgi:hypothetical protein
MQHEFKRQIVPISYIQGQKLPDAKIGFSPSVTSYGLDQETLLLVVETINAGSQMFLAQEAGDNEAKVLFQALLKWGALRDDVYFACQDKKINLKQTNYMQTYYPEHLFFLAQDAKKNPQELVSFLLDEASNQSISLKKVDLLRLVLSYAARPLNVKNIPIEI